MQSTLGIAPFFDHLLVMNSSGFLRFKSSRCSRSVMLKCAEQSTELQLTRWKNQCQIVNFEGLDIFFLKSWCKKEIAHDDQRNLDYKIGTFLGRRFFRFVNTLTTVFVSSLLICCEFRYNTTQLIVNCSPFHPAHA